MASACVLFLWATPAPPCLAAENPANVMTTAAVKFATVYRLRGVVKAKPADQASSGNERILREGDVVHVGDKLIASGAAEAVLKTADDSMVALRPGTEFIVEEFSAANDVGGKTTLHLVTGALRVITGRLGKLNPAGQRIVTPSSTIGIRGTDHEPYVLTSDVPASNSATPYRAGTYDKVNRGSTTLSSAGQALVIDPGRVGFARADTGDFSSKALMTLLLPVLLDKIPEFYVPGEFDAELDRYPDSIGDAPEPTFSARPSLGIAAVVATPSPPASNAANGECTPESAARQWLATLDDAITRKDAAAILGQFATDVSGKSLVRTKDGRLTALEFTRDELVRSTLATVSRLEGYQHRRISIKAQQDSSGAATDCRRLQVRSVVIEQGRLSGKPYRFESSEYFVLEQRGGLWLAIRAESTQR